MRVSITTCNCTVNFYLIDLYGVTVTNKTTAIQLLDAVDVIASDSNNNIDTYAISYNSRELSPELRDRMMSDMTMLVYNINMY